jgi:hypothetical protein
VFENKDGGLKQVFFVGSSFKAEKRRKKRRTDLIQPLNNPQHPVSSPFLQKRWSLDPALLLGCTREAWEVCRELLATGRTAQAIFLSWLVEESCRHKY